MWQKIALEAFNIAFDNNENKKNINNDLLNTAIELFYNSIAHGADKYWPYIKLADLIEDKKEKTKLYIQAFRVEPNQYSAQYLFDQILKDNPFILDKYLI
jgi:hypothetical protein